METTSYWARLFAKHGFLRDVDHDADYLAPQAILFRRSSPDLETVVADYERSLWNTREAFEIRNQALDEGWRGSVSHAQELASGVKELEEGWEQSAARVAELEKLLVDRADTSDQRTVAALERLVDPDALRALVAGPPITGEPLDTGRFAFDDYVKWREARIITPAPDPGPLISIVVPVFNPQPEHLTACIRSVRAQTYTSWELVLVDVSTAPHVRPICDRFESLDPRVRVLRRDNAGIAENTDPGVQTSEGDWIVFLDHDDTLEEHALASVARYVADPR